MAGAPAAAADTGDPLAYYGGPVAHSMTGVVVDWGSSVNSIYTNDTNGDPGLVKYFASASGSTADIGGVLAQYLDTTGQNAVNQVSYGGQIPITPSVTATTIYDSQIQSELKAQIGAAVLPHPAGNGMQTIYLVLFPAGDTECISAQECSGAQLCAYHGNTRLTDGTAVLYAVLPDNTTGPMSQGCGQASTPLANQTSYTSHEWAETITDPLVNEASTNSPPLAWYDNRCPTSGSACGEIGDKCNQQQGLNGGWTVQLEWSNLDSACTSSEPSYPGPTASFSIGAGPAAGQPVSFDASSSSDPPANHASASYGGTPYSLQAGISGYDWNWGDGTADGAGVTASHTFAQPGTYQVSVTVTDNLGFKSTLTHRLVVSSQTSSTDPFVVTGGSTGVSDQGATIQGSIDPENQPVSYSFAYGTSATSLNQSTAAVPLPAGLTYVPVSATLSGLSATTKYYYRLDVVAGGQTFPGQVKSFTTNATPPPPQNPVAGTGRAGGVTTGSAVLNGTVNPGGPSGVLYRFEYGTSATTLDNATNLAVEPAGSTAMPVSVTITGLTPATTYYYRLDVQWNGNVYTGAVSSFTTLTPPPGATTGGVQSVLSTSATATGTVNPNGVQTTYLIEFGPTTSYGLSSLAAPAGAGTAAAPVAAALTGLRPATLYHYRVVASSAGGTTVGADSTFTTAPPPPPPPRFTFRGPPRVSLRAALHNGIKLRFRCSKACTARFAVTIALSGITRIAGIPVTLGRGSGKVRGAGSRTVTVGLTRAARATLASGRSVKLVITGYATSPGSSPTASRSARLTLTP